ncbi:hypothetical protein GGI12_000261 [Dipsacomyces acuminosporus]|nr:hypothetical protein GGI12_000261 [Dipsacomyces acuminosporus]
MPSYTPLRLEDYDISPVHGFLPTEQPLQRLPDPYYEPWEKIMDKFNQYLLAHQIRKLVRKLPVLDTDKLTTKAEYQRAFTILGFMAHAFVWGKNGAASEPASEFLPAAISIPWVAAADYLELNPVICCAAVCHWNWQILDPAAEDPMDIDNIGTLYTFSGSMDESWFYLVTTAMEAKSARGLNAILDGIRAVEKDDIAELTAALNEIAHSLQDANMLLERMYERCDPYVFYWKIREFLAGWENMAEAGLPYGVLYEGVDDTDTFSLDNWQSLIRRFRKYAGGSAAQTPLLQAFDIALGIKHYPTGKKGAQTTVSEARLRLANAGVPEPPAANSYLVRMRDYMPGGHRRFLEDLAATCTIREYVLLACSDSVLQRNAEADQLQIALRLAYNKCVGLMREFRDKHIMIVTRYIIMQAKKGPSLPVRPVTPVSSHIIPAAAQERALAASTPAPGGRLGGDSLPADPTMYPQTNTGAMSRAAAAAAHPPSGPHGHLPPKARLARKIDDDSVVRGTGGTDAIQFLKQVPYTLLANLKHKPLALHTQKAAGMPRDRDDKRDGSSRHRSRSSRSNEKSEKPSSHSSHREREYDCSSSRDRSKRRSRHGSASPEYRRSKSSSKAHRDDKHRRSHRHRHKSSKDADGSDINDSDSGRKVGGYTNADNPFNDSALGKKFVWKKKIEQDKAKGLSREEREEADRQRREEAELELENLRKRREQREIEKELRDQEMARIRREAEQEKLGDWERREEEFYLQQAKKRAEIRISDNRPKPIDILAMNLRLAHEQLDDEEVCLVGSIRFDVARPDRIVEGLELRECNELKQEADMYLSLESNPRNVEFWENLLIVCEAHLEALNSARSGAVVEKEIKDMLAGKSLEELARLDSDVQAKLDGHSGAVDVDYWEHVRKQLVVEKAKATLGEMHQDILERRLERLREARSRTDPGSSSKMGDYAGEGQQIAGGGAEQRKRRRLEELQRRILEEQAAGGGLPDLRAAASSERDHADSSDISHELYEAEFRKKHDPSEAIFSVEAAVQAKSYAWQDKHRPRKPRYFNRVHTGYEWNKYNQTHYDKDNPPPKVVQGYKFNIFYPDLIDKSQAPTYRVESDPSGGEDTVVLRFIAGPPYEDIAFKIVNREWEYNRRRGFRNTFDRGVLQLYFRFKRHYYRR